MPTFSRRSLARLGTCHPDLQVLFRRVVLDHDCTILVGERPRIDQDMAVRRGTSTLLWPKGRHNVDGIKRVTAWAVDVAPYPIDWHGLDRFRAFAVVVKATAAELLASGEMKHAVFWGGGWAHLVDMPHWELVGVADGE